MLNKKLFQRVLKQLLIAIILLVADKTIAQVAAKNKPISPDTSISIRFDWALENERRKSNNLTYQGANICSRWIKFSDQKFLTLKDFDGKNVKITLQRSVWEGLKSKEARGVDTFGMQGTDDNIGCECILTIELHD